MKAKIHKNMTNKEAMETVLSMAEGYWNIDQPNPEAGKRQQEAIFQMRDYKNDVLED
jgi:hypothetical protein